MNDAPDLTREEINDLCAPLVQPAAQIRYLRSLGLTVARRRDGTPLVSRQHYITVRGAGQRAAPAGPAWKVAA